jgi:hypothetical protein
MISNAENDFECGKWFRMRKMISNAENAFECGKCGKTHESIQIGSSVCQNIYIDVFNIFNVRVYIAELFKLS